MAIVRGAPGAVAYSASNGSSISVAYPTGNGTGDKLVLIIGMKPSTANSGSVTTPSGWTLVTSITGQGGFGTTVGGDTGNTNLFVFERIVPAGGLTGSLAVTVAANNICWGYMEWLTTDARGWRNSAGATGGDGAPGVAFTVNFTSDPGVNAGDLILVSVCIPTDLGGGAQFSGQTLTQTGITFGVFGETNEPATNTGNDIAGWNGYAPVSAGTSSAAPVLNLTASGTVTNVRGPATFVRVRDAYLMSADPGAFSISGQEATLTQASGSNKSLQASAGSATLTGQAATVARNRVVTASSGTLTLTGSAATIARSRKLTSAAGSYALTGTAASVLFGRRLNGAAGSYAGTGQAATLSRTTLYKLDAQAASIDYAGQSAELVYVRALQLNAEAGTFLATGQSATLTKVKVYALDAQPTAFELTGQVASLAYTQSLHLNAEAAAFSLLGADASLTKVNVYNLSAQAADFNLSGQAATLLASRALEAQPTT